MPQITDPPKTGAARQGCSLHVITTPTADTTGSTLVLHFNDKRYLFGRISEGTQRACIQRTTSLRKVRNIFITGPTSWDTNGGLIGMILTMAEVQSGEREEQYPQKRPRLNIHGGSHLLHTMACARRFVFRTGMPLVVHDNPLENTLTGEPVFADENIRVWAINLGGTGSDSLDSDLSSSKQRPSLTQDTTSGLTEDQEVRKAIIHDMFDSEWRKDRLIETALKDVKLPATIWLRDPQTKNLQGINCLDQASLPQLDPEHKVFVRNPWPASLIGNLPDASNLPEQSTYSYIAKGYSQRGVFDPKKAIELGVKPGPNFGKLAAGSSVMSEQGIEVTPEMVLGQTQPGKGFAMFDISNLSHLENLKTQLKTASINIMEGVETIVWALAHPSLLHSVVQFAQSMPGIKHILAEHSICGNYLSMESSAYASSRLSQISPQHFSVPLYNNTVDHTALPPGITAGKNSNFVVANRGLKVVIEPRNYVDQSEVPSLVNVPTTRSRSSSHASTGEVTTEMPCNDDLSEPEITTLGTGSAIPSKYRNVSSTLLRMPGNMGNYLFDCGENTIGQLKRLYKADELENILANLRIIWISHLHADHHLGTISVLKARKLVQDRYESSGKSSLQPVCVMSEANMLDFLREYASVETFTGDRKYITPIVCAFHTGPTLDREPLNMAEHKLPIKEIRSTKVSHCHGAQAVSITFENDFKISYSGDCRPSSMFATIGQDSDVLIHEATFEDGKEGDAMAKKHSTTGEALGVALKMKAKNVVLTHFSQRYQQLPVLSEIKLPEEIVFEDTIQAEEPMSGPVDTVTGEDDCQSSLEPSSDSATHDTQKESKIDKEALRKAAASQMHICVAFDFMHVKVSDIKNMKDLFPAIEQMVEEATRASEEGRFRKHQKVEDEAKRKRASGQTAKQLKSASKSAAKQLYDSNVPSPAKSRTSSANGSSVDLSLGLENAPSKQQFQHLNSNGTVTSSDISSATDPNPPKMSKRQLQTQRRKFEATSDKSAKADEPTKLPNSAGPKVIEIPEKTSLIGNEVSSVPQTNRNNNSTLNIGSDITNNSESETEKPESKRIKLA